MSTQAIGYTSFPATEWRLFKQISKDHSEAAYLKWQFRVLVELKNIGRDDDLSFLEMRCAFLWRFRPLTHYFLARGVADFCVASVREVTDDFLRVFPACDPVDAPAGLCALVGVPEQKMDGGFAIHFPANERKRSIVVIPKVKFNHPTLADTARLFVAGAFDGEDLLLLSEKGNWTFQDAGQELLAKTLYGFTLYLDAFPETIKAATLSEVLMVGRIRGASHFVGRAECVSEDERSSVSPHWRRGHFRVLASPRFSKKQWQTIYVRGTFVKGKALDVEMAVHVESPS